VRECQRVFISTGANHSAARRDGDENLDTNSLLKRGINKVAQKVGEEAVEVVIEAKDNNDELFKKRVGRFVVPLFVLLRAKGFTLKI
jgi:phosphoribosyl-ATP pyrophosphohydrolase/phosphoribosyl-AMP cyclohydrolase